MPNLSVVLAANLTVTDTTLSPSPTIVSRSFGNPTNLATVTFYDPFFQCTGATTVNLPSTTCFVAYVKNLDAAANLTVAWTAVGAAGSSTFLLVPGGVFVYFQPTEGAGGFTAMTLTPSAGTISAEVFISK